MRQTFSSELRHKNKSEIVCMCPITSAVVRAKSWDVSGDYPTKISKQRIRVASVDENSIGFGSMVFVVASIYAVTVLFCVGITAWIVRAWTRRRYWHKSPSDLHYIAAGAALLVGAGIGILIASQIVMALAISLI
jgi:hypothetical protein